ncbi:MAG TPA: OsmC family protein [Terriglobales bacterium]|nr:OsmC family protein [Terriglobales bacterium]
MLGTFAGALDARQVDVSGPLIAEVRGEIESEDGVLVIKRIHVALQLKASEDARATVERVHGIYAQKCPVYRSLYKAIDITSSYELVK